MKRLLLGRLRRESGSDLETFFGRLEVRVLKALWQRGTQASVRDLQAAFPATAYTTLMTTLDRLHRKGVLDRVKAGRAFLYQPRYSCEELRLGFAEDALDAILELEPGGSPRPILSFFVETVSRRDRSLLDELERLVREQRRKQQREAT